MKAYIIFIFLQFLLLFTVDIKAQPLSLVKPYHQFTGSDSLILFEWNSINDAMFYELEISSLPDFSASTQLITNIVNAYYELSFSGSQVIFWHVRARLDTGLTPWSSTRRCNIIYPDSLMSLNLWFRADWLDSLDGSRILFLKDNSGKNNHLIQNDTLKAPILYNNILNSFPVLRFDGVNDNMVSSFSYSGTSITSFLVQKVLSSASLKGSLSIYNSGFSNDYSTYNTLICSWLNGGANSLDCYRVNTCKYTSTYLNNWSVYGTRVGSASLQSFVNGVFIQQVPSQGNFNTTNITLGSRWENSNFQSHMNFEFAELLVFNEELTDSLKEIVQWYLFSKYAPDVTLGRDIILDSLSYPLISAGNGFKKYLWSTGDTVPEIIATKSGYYMVTVTDIMGRTSSDTIRIQLFTRFVNQPSEITICSDSVINIASLIQGNFSFLWSNGSTNDSITVSEPGMYWLSVTDSTGNAYVSDTVVVTVDYFPTQASLDHLQQYCIGNYLCLQGPSDPTIQYNWSNGSTFRCIEVTEQGLYSIVAIDSVGCQVYDSINISLPSVAPIVFFTYSPGCVGDSLIFTDLSICNDSIIEWKWEFGDGDESYLQNPAHIFRSSGNFNVTLRILTDKGCWNFHEMTIIVPGIPIAYFYCDSACWNSPMHFSDSSTCMGQDSIVNWLWTFGDGSTSTNQHPTHQFSDTGYHLVSLRIISAKGCEGYYERLLKIIPSIELPTPVALIYPFNNALISDSLIVLSWEKSPNAYLYKIQLSKDSTFPFGSTSTLRTNFDTCVFHLSEVGKYYWRLSAFNFCMDSIVSQLRSFSYFLPNEITGLKLWLYASKVDTLPLGLVNNWKDQSGLMNNANQSQISNLPAYKSFVLNNLPVIRFDGVNDHLIGDFTHGEEEVSVFFVKRMTSNTFNSGSLSLFNTSILNDWDNYNSLVCSYLRPGTNSLDCFRYSSCFFTHDFFNKWFIYEIEVDSSSLDSYVNGVSAFSIPSQGNFNTTNYVLGSRWIGGANQGFMSFEIAELIIFDHKLTSIDRTNIIEYIVEKYTPPPIYLRKEIIREYGFCPYYLDAGVGYDKYLWSTGDTTQVIEIQHQGWVNVIGTNAFGLYSSDSIFIVYPNTKIRDTTICIGDTLDLSAKLKQSYSHKWSSFSQDSISCDSVFRVWEAGTYWLTLRDTLGCYLTDTFRIEVDSFPLTATLGGDSLARCEGEFLGLAAGGGEAMAYTWNNGSTEPQVLIQAPGLYSVTVTNARTCRAVDSTVITLKGLVPVAVFAATDSVCLGETMVFTDLSHPAPQDTTATILIWYWDFGDTSFAAQQNPLHVFQYPGNHTVTLAVETDAGCLSRDSAQVYVYPLPRAAFLTARGCTGLAVPFDDYSYYPAGEGVSWEWDFGDPGSGTANFSALQAPYHIYTTAGNYLVRLMVSTASDCKDTCWKPVEILAAPDINFSYSQTCEGAATQFTDISSLPPWNPALGWVWDFGDGTAPVAGQHPRHQYQHWGDYTVTLTMKTFQCELSLEKQLVVDARPQVANNAGDVCEGTEYQFVDLSTVANGQIEAWHWDFGSQGTSKLQDPKVLYPLPGTYPVQLLVFSDKDCASDTLNYTIEVFPNPVAAFSSNINLSQSGYSVDFVQLASPDVLLYAWDFGDGTTSWEANPQHHYADSGVYTVSLSVFTVNGCSDTARANLVLLAPVLEVVLTEVLHQIDSEDIRFGADLYNAGTRNIHGIDLKVSVEGIPLLKESWSGLLAPDSSFRYLFAASLPLQGQSLPHYYCIEASLPAANETDLGNNKQCKAIENRFHFPDPYPNPVSESLYLNLVIPENADIQFDILNTLGQSCWGYSVFQGKKGINQLQFTVIELPAGVYSLRMLYQGKAYLKRFLKM